jgi:hypothetical protein
MQNFKIIAYLLLGCIDSGGYVKFTPKYMIVGGEVGVSEFFLGCNLFLLVTQDHIHNCSLPPSRLY